MDGEEEGSERIEIDVEKKSAVEGDEEGFERIADGETMTEKRDGYQTPEYKISSDEEMDVDEDTRLADGFDQSGTSGISGQSQTRESSPGQLETKEISHGQSLGRENSPSQSQGRESSLGQSQGREGSADCSESESSGEEGKYSDGEVEI